MDTENINEIDYTVVMSDTVPAEPAGMEELLDRPVSDDEYDGIDTKSDIFADVTTSATMQTSTVVKTAVTPADYSAVISHAENLLDDIDKKETERLEKEGKDKSELAFRRTLLAKFGAVDQDADLITAIADKKYTATIDGLEVLARICTLNKSIPLQMGMPTEMPPVLCSLYKRFAVALDISQTSTKCIQILDGICKKAQNPVLNAILNAIIYRWDKLTDGDVITEKYERDCAKVAKEQQKIIAEAIKKGEDVNTLKLPQMPDRSMYESMRKIPTMIDSDAAYIKDFSRLWGYDYRKNITDGIVYCGWKPMDDGQVAMSTTWAKSLGIPVKDPNVMYAQIETLAAGKDWNPYVEWLQKLPEWDGHDYISDFVKKIEDEHGVFPIAFRVWVHNLIHRILHGGQGISLFLLGDIKAGKSTLAKYLASALPNYRGEIPESPKTYSELIRLFDLGVNPDKDEMVNFFSDRKFRFDSDDDMYSLKIAAASCLIMEIPEFELSVKSLANSKAFLTSSTNSIRKKYAKYDSVMSLNANFILTSNPKVFLEEDSHRYLPVIVVHIDHSYIEIPMVQIYAQALHNIQSGYAWQLTKEEEKQFGKIMQEAREESDFSDWVLDNFYVDKGTEGCDWFVSNNDLRQAIDLSFKQGARGIGKTNVSTALTMIGATQTTGSMYASVLGKTSRGWKGLTPRPEAIERFVIEAGVEECTDSQGNSFQRKKYAPLFGQKYLDPTYLASGIDKNDTVTKKSPATTTTDTTPAAETTSDADAAVRAEVAFQAVSYTMDGGPQLPIADTEDEFEPPF